MKIDVISSVKYEKNKILGCLDFMPIYLLIIILLGGDIFLFLVCSHLSPLSKIDNPSYQ